MVARILHWIGNRPPVGPAVRAFLWWGIGLRLILLFALATLLVADGNVVGEWLLSLQVAPGIGTDVQEYTMLSYAGALSFLVMGTLVRWSTLRSLGDEEADGASGGSVWVADVTSGIAVPEVGTDRATGGCESYVECDPRPVHAEPESPIRV